MNWHSYNEHITMRHEELRSASSPRVSPSGMSGLEFLRLVWQPFVLIAVIIFAVQAIRSASCWTPVRPPTWDL